MQTPHKTKPINIIVMITMVFCVVFSTSIKAAIDSIDTAKKTTSQQLLDEEANEKESKTEKEVYPKYSSFQNQSMENYISNCLISVFHSPLKITLPYLKVHTPPPDLSFLI